MAHLRTLLVLFHLVAITAMALPGPTSFTRKLFEGRAAQEELTSWVSRLDGIGIHLTVGQFTDLVWEVGSRMATFRIAAQEPFLPYARWCGTGQGWRMFAFINRVPSRLEIDVEEGGLWRPLYRPRSPTLRWEVGRLEQERMRGLMTSYSWRTKATTWPKFAAWVSREALLDFPEATRVRVQLRRVTSPSPEQVLAGEIPEGKPEQVRLFSR